MTASLLTTACVGGIGCRTLGSCQLCQSKILHVTVAPHHDFSDLMLDPTDLTRITTVLDWEMVTVGDPLMDLGATLGYWLSPDANEQLLSMPFNPCVLMKSITREELVEWYAEASSRVATIFWIML